MAHTSVEADRRFDVAIIGAGVVGCSIAQALSRHRLQVVLVEAADDVGTGSSKANSAILHTGFDAPVGSLEARLVARGHRLLTDYAATVGIPLVKTGATLVAWRWDDTVSLQRIRSTAMANGYGAIDTLTGDDVYHREPHLGPGVVAGLAIPDESIVCPFTTPLALATEAVLNGVALKLGCEITAAERTTAKTWRLITGAGPIEAQWVINTAGLHGDSVAQMFGAETCTIHPRRGQFIVFDKAASSLVHGIVLGVPSPTTKGVLLAPTVFGNLLLGPTAEDLEDKSATETTESGLSSLMDQGLRMLPGLEEMEVTSVYSGLRAVSDTDGYDIGVDAEGRYANVLGIRSTGLSASMAIAEHLLDGLSDAGLPLEAKTDWHRVAMPYIGEDRLRPHADDLAIAADPSSGRVMCFCEHTTLAELEAAAVSPIPPTSLEGLFRRTRATGGRCQGFYCRAQVTAWLANRLEKGPSELLGIGGR